METDLPITRRELLSLALQETSQIIRDNAYNAQSTLRLINEKRQEESERRASLGISKYKSLQEDAETYDPKVEGSKELIDFYNADGVQNWIKIETEKPTASRYMEFFLPQGSVGEDTVAQNKNLDPLKSGRMRRMSVDSSSSEVSSVSSSESVYQDVYEANPLHEPYKKACGMCAMHFPQESLVTSVPRQLIFRLRRRWADQFGLDRQTAEEHKFRFRLYDMQKVCMFCSQLFEVDLDETLKKDAQKQQQRRREVKRNGRSTNSDVVVSVTSINRLEEMWHYNVANGKTRTPLKRNFSIKGDGLRESITSKRPNIPSVSSNKRQSPRAGKQIRQSNN